MFDWKDQNIINKKLRLIEILLIVGGILGGFVIQKDFIINFIFVIYLLMAIIYYILISDLPLTSKFEKFGNKLLIFISAFFVSICLPALIVYSIITDTNSIFEIRILFIFLWLFFSGILLISLYYDN